MKAVPCMGLTKIGGAGQDGLLANGHLGNTCSLRQAHPRQLRGAHMAPELSLSVPSIWLTLIPATDDLAHAEVEDEGTALVH